MYTTPEWYDTVVKKKDLILYTNLPFKSKLFFTLLED
jgi:hypothetical protein